MQNSKGQDSHAQIFVLCWHSDWKILVCSNRAVSTPLFIVIKCCRNLLGYQACVDTWYSGTEAINRTCPMNLLGYHACVDTWYSGTEAMNRTCPMYCAERGVNETMALRGLTEFMEGIQKLWYMKMTLTAKHTRNQKAIKNILN